MDQLNGKLFTAMFAVALMSTGVFAGEDWERDYNNSPTRTRRQNEDLKRSITFGDLRYGYDSDDEAETVRAKVAQQTQRAAQTERTVHQPLTLWGKIQHAWGWFTKIFAR